MNLHVAKIKETKSGMKAMVLVENPKDKTSATVIFRGTSCDKEWLDNGQGGYLSDTEGQKQSLQRDTFCRNKRGKSDKYCMQGCIKKYIRVYLKINQNQKK